MKKGLLLLLLLVLGISFVLAQEPDSRNPEDSEEFTFVDSVPRDIGNWVAGQGRIEPLGEVVRLSFEVSGILEEIHVAEGDEVRAGQAMARLKNQTHQAEVREAQSLVAIRQAELDKLRSGTRPEAKRQALAELEQARTLMENALREAKRRQQLADKGYVGQETTDRAWTEYKAARQRLESRRQVYLQSVSARKEDVNAGRARLEQARARLDTSRARLEQTVLRAPGPVTVLKLHLRPGERVSPFFHSPVASVGDLSRLRLRVEVDEEDLAKIRVGQEAFARADAYGAREFKGEVVDKGRMIGPKTITGDDPGERKDRKVLEVLVEFDSHEDLLPGLRMDAFIRVAHPNENAAGGS
jgi:ABC exporter DevB family membrane fusion protein